MTAPTELYAARLDVDYPVTLDRVTTTFRIIWIIPIAIVLSVLSASGGGIVLALFGATVLMILFRQRYPRWWWFDFALQFNRFATRVTAYGALLTDRYPSTVEEQSVHLDIDYPDAEHDLNRWLPLVKWLLVIPDSRSRSTSTSIQPGRSSGRISTPGCQFRTGRPWQPWLLRHGRHSARHQLAVRLRNRYLRQHASRLPEGHPPKHRPERSTRLPNCRRPLIRPPVRPRRRPRLRPQLRQQLRNPSVEQASALR